MRFDFNDFRLRKYSKITKKILALDKEYQQLTDEQLQAKTTFFREKLAQGARWRDFTLWSSSPDEYR